MKNASSFITGIFFLLFGISGYGQSFSIANASVIKPFPLSITYSKTTTLIFPFAIKCVDRGSKDVLAQKAKGVENVLYVKAARRAFAETSLSVITSDGNLYTYLVNYAANPNELSIQIKPSEETATSVFLSPDAINEGELKAVSGKIATEKRFILRKKDKRYGMNFRLDGLYIKDDALYYQISLSNQTFLDYDIDQLRFFIRDQRKPKRTASQEREIQPLFIHNNILAVHGKSTQVMVFALPRFTIPDGKYLTIQLMEKNGGRNLKLKIYNRQLVQAKPVKE
jgi:conjugative transposon TraN protein